MKTNSFSGYSFTQQLLSHHLNQLEPEEHSTRTHTLGIFGMGGTPGLTSSLHSASLCCRSSSALCQYPCCAGSAASPPPTNYQPLLRRFLSSFLIHTCTLSQLAFIPPISLQARGAGSTCEDRAGRCGAHLSRE